MMYGSMVFSRVLAIVEKSEMGLYEVPKLLFLVCFGMGMMLASFNICGVMLVLISIKRA